MRGRLLVWHVSGDGARVLAGPWESDPDPGYFGAGAAFCVVGSSLVIAQTGHEAHPPPRASRLWVRVLPHVVNAPIAPSAKASTK